MSTWLSPIVWVFIGEDGEDESIVHNGVIKWRSWNDRVNAIERFSYCLISCLVFSSRAYRHFVFHIIRSLDDQDLYCDQDLYWNYYFQGEISVTLLEWLFCHLICWDSWDLLCCWNHGIFKVSVCLVHYALDSSMLLYSTTLIIFLHFFPMESIKFLFHNIFFHRELNWFEYWK